MKSAIRTDRLLIRPRSVTDIEDCIAMDSDPMVTQYIDGPWDDPQEHRSFVLNNMANTDPFPFGYWAITGLEPSETFLGWIMIIPTSSSFTQAEIGWRLTRQSWGQGIAAEAANRVVELVFSSWPKLEIFAMIRPDNLSSAKVAGKIGMLFDHEDVRGAHLEYFYTLRNAASG